MIKKTTLRDLPLWRLIVALDDAERSVGSGSSTARALANAIRERLRQQDRRREIREGRSDAE
jgi:hypothetical protein